VLRAIAERLTHSSDVFPSPGDSLFDRLR
jgi:hypothetical protein